MTKPGELNAEKVELINDLLATATVLEELWRYHPENKDRKDVVKEYNILLSIKGGIEGELAELDK
jgi:hypothetical protein